jgi:predicted  nucleic acid-binding Zn-ribbon protein
MAKAQKPIRKKSNADIALLDRRLLALEQQSSDVRAEIAALHDRIATLERRIVHLPPAIVKEVMSKLETELKRTDAIAKFRVT